MNSETLSFWGSIIEIHKHLIIYSEILMKKMFCEMHTFNPAIA